MSTIIHHLNHLSPEELDRYLQHGWRTTGQAVYNCNFLWLEHGEMVSVLPMRLHLDNHRFSKSMRKILRRNLSRFRICYGPGCQPDEDVLDVNDAYLRNFPKKSLYNIDYHIVGNYHRRVLNTWECRVYDKERLIAISFFDLGSSTAYGKAGIYDPEYQQHSLGLFTMALEIEFCKRRQLKHYFPGYVSDEHPLFDYKHRIGAMDYFDIFTQKWRPYGKDIIRQKPLEIIRYQLELAIQAFDKHPRIDAELLVYPHLDARYASMGHNEYFDVPLFVMLQQTGYDRYHILTYLPHRACFQVAKVKESQFALNRGNLDQSGLRNCSFALIVEKVLIEGPTQASDIVERYISSYCI